MNNRNKAQEFCLKLIKAMNPNDDSNVKIYEERFKSMTDREFESWMHELKANKEYLDFTAPNLKKIDPKRNDLIKLAKRLKIALYQRLELTNPRTGIRYITPNEFLILNTIVRRQSQHQTKGKSVPEDNLQVDVITKQPVGKSDTSALSLPEFMSLEAMNHINALIELTNARGGNDKAFREMKRQLLDNGEISLKDLAELDSRPGSVDAMKAYLNAMHYQNNI